jgi:hypothetical protein
MKINSKEKELTESTNANDSKESISLSVKHKALTNPTKENELA